ncbi:MAG: hypothetical protein ABIH25_01030, partial [Candidatus Woesearchaeota archaeon]
MISLKRRFPMAKVCPTMKELNKMAIIKMLMNDKISGVQASEMLSYSTVHVSRLQYVYVNVKRKGDTSPLKVLEFKHNDNSYWIHEGPNTFQNYQAGLLLKVMLYERNGIDVAKTVEYIYNSWKEFPQSLQEVKYPKSYSNIDANDKATYTYTSKYGYSVLSHINDVRAPKGYTDLGIDYEDIYLGKVLQLTVNTEGTVVTIGKITNWTDTSRTYQEARGYSKIVTVDDDYSIKTETDALGNKTSYDYDGNLNTTAITNARGNVTYYGYDDKGNMTSMTDALGNVTDYEYETQDEIFSYVT